MRAITYATYGAPSVLEVADVPKPKPGPGDVLIRVRAAEATKSDTELRSFRYSVMWFWLPLRIAMGIKRPRRQILGGYFAGEVVETGPGTKRLNTGDRVFGSAGLRLGAYGEYVALPERSPIALMPERMTFEEAAAVPLGGLNALHFMRLAAVQPGESVLVNGAGGVIGAHGVQIAKMMGAEVTAVDHGDKKPLLDSIGADHFHDYSAGHFADGGGAWDVIFDMVPGTDYARCIDALRTGGRYLSGNPRLSVMLRSALTTRFTDKTARFRFAAETLGGLNDLSDMIDAGHILPIADRVLPMSEAALAHRLVETEQRLGAIVLRIE